MLHRGRIQTALALVSLLLLGGCASFTGYPEDPVPGSSDLPALRDYFDPQRIVEYDRLTDPQQRRQMRDAVVWGRISAYDVKFRQFRKKLASETNGTNVGSDITTLILSGVGATTGTAGTKSALAAATNVVTGAKGSLSKNLFYEKTLPALFTQMDANRTKVLARITKGLSTSDAEYPLQLALLDLSAYADAGSIPGAIAGVTEQAAMEKAAAEVDISDLRESTFGNSASTQRLVAWLYPNGKEVGPDGKSVPAIPARWDALQDWLNQNGLGDLAPYVLVHGITVHGEKAEGYRVKAIKDLNIP
jgi:hypothetical protein